MSKIDQRLTNYYQAQTLNSSRLQSILAQSQRSRQRRRIPLYAAAAVVMMIMIGLLHQRSLDTQRISVALREAAMNHATKLQLDVEAQTMPDLQLSLEHLPFDLVLPAGSIYERLALIGGRYCTISGNLAAHLKFSDPGSGEQYSLFMTPLVGNLKSLGSEPEQINGVEVKLWQENDVVYAMAKSASSNKLPRAY